MTNVNPRARRAYDEYLEQTAQEEKAREAERETMYDAALRDLDIQGSWDDTGAEMSLDDHFAILLQVGATGDEWRCYSARLGFDSRPLADRRELPPRGAFRNGTPRPTIGRALKEPRDNEPYFGDFYADHMG